jgi:hypothetical protein
MLSAVIIGVRGSKKSDFRDRMSYEASGSPTACLVFAHLNVANNHHHRQCRGVTIRYFSKGARGGQLVVWAHSSHEIVRRLVITRPDKSKRPVEQLKRFVPL